MITENESARAIIDNLPKVSDDELKEIDLLVQAELKKRISSMRVAAGKAIKELAMNAGLLIDIKYDSEFTGSARSLTTNKPAKIVRPIKYRDPDNKNNIWTGAGIRPQWLKDKIEEGAKIDDFLIATE